MLNMINSLRRSILLLVFCFYIHGFSNSLAVSDCFQFWKMSLVVWLWKEEYLLCLKSVQDIRLPRSPSRLQEAKGGLQPKEGKLKVEPIEERR